ncbi:hypothetical protein N431DRAFT_443091 [Stipitochalara longipes BDJ]|nr:hypothetical protein N431DRAFT_443091 [Stipitochalara longipes BDJ]
MVPHLWSHFNPRIGLMSRTPKQGAGKKILGRITWLARNQGRLGQLRGDIISPPTVPSLARNGTGMLRCATEEIHVLRNNQEQTERTVHARPHLAALRQGLNRALHSSSAVGLAGSIEGHQGRRRKPFARVWTVAQDRAAIRGTQQAGVQHEGRTEQVVNPAPRSAETETETGTRTETDSDKVPQSFNRRLGPSRTRTEQGYIE